MKRLIIAVMVLVPAAVWGAWGWGGGGGGGSVTDTAIRGAFTNYTSWPRVPYATTNSAGAVKPDGATITVDNNGVISAAKGGDGSGQAISSISGNTVIRNGNLYVATATGRWTFRNHSTGRMSIFANISGRLVPDASTSQFRWVHPATFAAYTTSGGYSVKVPANTWVDIVSYGSGVFQTVMTTQNLVKTGVNEHYVASGGAYLVQQDFNSGVNSAPSGWTTTTAPNNWSSTTSPLEGVGSLLLTANWQDADTTFTSFSDGYIAFSYKANTAVPSGTNIFTVKDSSGSDWGAIGVTSGAALTATMTGGATKYSDNISFVAGTKYFIKLHCVKGAGSNATMSVYKSNTGASGTWTQVTYTSGSPSDGTNALNIGGLAFMVGAVNGGTDQFDQVRVSTTDINY